VALNDKKGVTPDCRVEHDEPPATWTDLLTHEEWRGAVEVLGRDRLEELHALMTELTPTLRRAFVANLDGLRHVRPGVAVIFALARTHAGALDTAVDQAVAHSREEVRR
jgi:hypothetical protein